MSGLSPFHPGEIAVQRKAGVRDIAEKTGRMIGNEFPLVARRWVRQQSLIAAGGRGLPGEVWATVVLGEPGFLSVTSQGHLAIGVLPAGDDPVRQIIESGGELGSIVLEPLYRRRMRCNGPSRVTGDGWEIVPREVYGNCPKYIVPRKVPRQPNLESGPGFGWDLESRHRQWISLADTFFISTTNAESGADCSHRGGEPGFVRIEGNELTWDDFPGNAMFNTLGNLETDPGCGLVFLNWETGRMLQLSGTAATVWNGEERQMRFQVRRWREA